MFIRSVLAEVFQATIACLHENWNYETRATVDVFPDIFINYNINFTIFVNLLSRLEGPVLR